MLLTYIQGLIKLVHEFVLGPLRLFFKTTDARERDSDAPRKFYEMRFNDSIPTFRTQWLRDIQGDWHLLESDPIKKDALIIDLFERYGLTESVRREYRERKGVELIDLVHSYFQVGLPLIMEDFTKRAKAEIAYGNRCG